jgi:CHAT domain-containing protein
LVIAKDNLKAKVLLRKQASKTAVMKFSDQFRYVHFACHGIFNPDNPMESGLMLSSDDQKDGMLTVNDLYDMRLNADLVTLSACETALGNVSNGDDVVGFTRGFLYAGASSIVSSLWEVSDEATSILMQEFYNNLKDRDKRTALRLAQLKIKETYNSHPYFWAAFQLTGATQ